MTEEERLSDQLKKAHEWVSKSGFPMELETIEILKNLGWAVMPSVNYFDEDEAKWRELDIKAYRLAQFGESIIPNWSYTLRLTLIIQCKKSEKFIWIFFPTDLQHERRIECIDFLKVMRVQSLASRDPISIKHHRTLGVSRNMLSEPPLVTSDTAKQIRWLNELVIFGVDDFQSFINAQAVSVATVAPLSGGGKPPNELFEAAVTATKALVYERELVSEYHYSALSFLRDANLRSLINRESSLEVDIILPIIVFDGALLLWEGREKDLKQVDHVVYTFDNRSSHYFGGYMINILEKSILGEFLTNINADLENLIPKFQKKTREIEIYTGLLTSYPESR